jgi:hypothetical protein
MPGDRLTAVYGTVLAGTAMITAMTAFATAGASRGTPANSAISEHPAADHSRRMARHSQSVRRSTAKWSPRIARHRHNFQQAHFHKPIRQLTERSGASALSTPRAREDASTERVFREFISPRLLAGNLLEDLRAPKMDASHLSRQTIYLLVDSAKHPFAEAGHPARAIAQQEREDVNSAVHLRREGLQATSAAIQAATVTSSDPLPKLDFGQFSPLGSGHFAGISDAARILLRSR